jgi:hypothetical protein
MSAYIENLVTALNNYMQAHAARERAEEDPRYAAMNQKTAFYANAAEAQDAFEQELNDYIDARVEAKLQERATDEL